MTARILVADPIAQEGVDLLARECDVDLRPGLSADELLAAVGDYEGLLVRSQTRVTAEVVVAGERLRVIARAGAGVDNIDVDAATERGIVVVNAPVGNTVSAAELAVALTLALSRHVPAAAASLAAGNWERQRFLGVEVHGKTAGVVGLGQVGTAVARRLLAFDMSVLAHDPFVPEERAHSLGVQLLELPELLAASDFVTLHSTLTPGAPPVIGEAELALMKPGARLINTARGSLVDEQALLEALERGQLAGAALDVFHEEPATGSPLVGHPNVLATPHLGASTQEAQERVAIDVAQDVLRVLDEQPALAAVNAPFVDPTSLDVVGPYMAAADMAGRLATQLASGQLETIRIAYRGEIGNHDVTPLKAAAMAGLLAPISDEHVNLVSVNNVIEHRGLHVVEEKHQDASPFANLITVQVTTSGGGIAVSGTLEHGRPYAVEVDGFSVRVPGPPPGSHQHLLVLQNEDRPGRIGAVGTALGAMDVNISSMDVGERDDGSGKAVMVLAVDRVLPPEQIAELAAIDGIEQVVQAQV